MRLPYGHGRYAAHAAAKTDDGWRVCRHGGEDLMNGPRRVEIGAYECWILPDGDLTYPGPIVTPPGAETPSEVAVPYTAFLIDTGSTRILLDTGAGALGPRTGRLPESLEAAGFVPEDIHTVILSHAHPDHIGAVARFPNAAVVMMRREFEFWT